GVAVCFPRRAVAEAFIPSSFVKSSWCNSRFNSREQNWTALHSISPKTPAAFWSALSWPARSLRESSLTVRLARIVVADAPHELADRVCFEAYLDAVRSCSI